jgi:hypothetical protein
MQNPGKAEEKQNPTPSHISIPFQATNFAYIHEKQQHWGTATGLKEKKSFKCGINIYNVQRCRLLNGVWRKRSPVGIGDRMEFK